jgi:uncharacterized protein HemY
MSPLSYFGKLLILLGLFLALIGVLVLVAGKIPWLGKLPGDIFIQKKNFSFYFPLTTSIILSIILTLLLYFITRK